MSNKFFAVLRCRMFYVTFVLVMTAGVSIRYISPQYRSVPCTAIEAAWQAFGGDVASIQAGLDFDGVSPGFIASALRSLFGCDLDSLAYRPLAVESVAADARRVLPTALVLAFVLTPILGTDVSSSPRSVSPPTNPPPAPSATVEAELRRRLRVFVSRARQIRVVIAYALLSCLVTVLVPPSFAVATGAAFPAHLAALLVAAMLAGAWGVHDLAHSSRPACTLAIEVACLGVFIGGAVALAVAMPYRMLAPDDVALGLDHLRRFSLVRLALLPAGAALAAFLWVLVLRQYKRLPMRPWPSRPSRSAPA